MTSNGHHSHCDPNAQSQLQEHHHHHHHDYYNNNNQHNQGGTGIVTTTTTPHSHSHTQTKNGTCCARSVAAPRPEPPKPMTTEELVSSPQKQVFAVLSMLVRLGPYASLEPMIKTLIEQRNAEVTKILDMLGDDGHSLLHWAAKRGETIQNPYLYYFCTIRLYHFLPNQIILTLTHSSTSTITTS